MSDDNESIVRIVELTKELSNILEGVHIQSWINLIKYDITRFEKLQLQNLYLSTLSPTKTHIEISSQKIPLNMKWHYQRFDNLLEGKKGLLGSSFDIIDGSQKLKKFHSFDLWYLLKCHKNSYPPILCLLSIQLNLWTQSNFLTKMKQGTNRSALKTKVHFVQTQSFSKMTLSRLV